MILGLGCGIPAGLAVMLLLFGGCMAVLSAPTTPVAQPTASPVQETGRDPTAPAGSTTPPASETTENPEPASIGDTVTDGDFAFTVTDMNSQQTIGDGFLAEEAQGKYMLLDVTVENVDDRAHSVSANNVKLLADGNTYSGDTAAWALVENNPLLEQINPGNSVDGTFVFDIPEEVTPEVVELRGGPISDGVAVSLL